MINTSLPLRKIGSYSSLLCLLLVTGLNPAFAQFSTEEKVYKTVDSVQLSVKVYYPENHTKGSEKPAIIFYHGGGWKGGHMSQFAPHAEHYAQKGLVAVTVEYRVKSRHGTTPMEAVSDAKSAMRWLRDNAPEMGVDPGKIVAAGGSAGGHLAAAAATLNDFDSPTDDLSISPVPNALVLFNPAVLVSHVEQADRESGRKTEIRSISPYYHLADDVPPTIIFHGTDDTTIPIEDVQRYCRKMEEYGNRCELVTFKGQGHAFFNYGKADGKYFRKTVRLADQFLERLGYL